MMKGLLADSKENTAWSSVQAENRKARARAPLVLEIGLSQKNKKSGPMTGKHGNLGGVAVVRVELPEDTATFPVNGSHAVEVNAAKELFERYPSSVMSSPQHFVQAVEQKLGILLTDRIEFYERVGRELTLGRVDKAVLARLLQLEKAKLQKHRAAVEELHQAFLSWGENKNKEILAHGQLIVHKLGELLNERDDFHSKFEAQVELGHFFRLVKLLELQKSRHQLFRKAVDQIVSTLEGAVEQEKREPQKDHHKCFTSSTDSHSCNLSEQRVDSGELTIRASRNVENEQEVKHRKELRKQMLRLFQEQEQQWQARQQFIDAIERKLALAEQESRRLAEILKNRRWDSRGEREEKLSWITNLPAGYTSFYLSPLFQDQIGTSLPQLDNEVCNLKEEVSSLKLQLQDEQMKRKDGYDDHRHFSERAEIPTVEKTISVESFSSENELEKACKYLQPEIKDGETSHCILNDRRFVRRLVHDLLKLFQQHRGERGTEDLDELHLRVFKRISELSEELQRQSRKIRENVKTNSRVIELESHVEALKNELARINSEHQQQLEVKIKALEYAQQLNLQLASELSATKNAFSELRSQCGYMKASLEAKLKDSIVEAGELVENLKKQLDALEKLQLQKEQEMQAAKRRTETCQCGAERGDSETFARILALNEEVEKQSSLLEQAEAKLAFLLNKNRQSEHLNMELSQKISRLEEEVESFKEENDRLQSGIVDMQSELVRREEALETLTVQLASTIENHSARQERAVETLRSKHLRRQLAKKSILLVEEKMAKMAAQAKLEMEEMKACIRRIQR